VITALLRRRRPDPPDLNQPVVVRRPPFSPAPGFVLRSLGVVAVVAIAFFALRGTVQREVSDAIDRMVTSEREPEVEEASLDIKVLSTADAPLEAGSTGPAVVDLQRILNYFGFDAGTPDGAYGNRTSEAVRMYELSRRLDPDGIADERTLAVLLDDVSRQASLPAGATTTAPGQADPDDPLADPDGTFGQGDGTAPVDTDLDDDGVPDIEAGGTPSSSTTTSTP
jgi:peptidoglycan hydrolase-like protein with peptidoglycan-binding domain